ncbi:hypothetical protein LZ32DRAFT_44048 [Colletotrichum eremochloae]|nr:hypothetical protein LZ32DRAFT_44048 [Colletotrichum eremochloae]
MERSSRDLPQLVADDPPPPYSKEEDTRALSSDAPARVSWASSFPQHLNGYGGKKPTGRSYYDLGASRNEKRFSVCTKCFLTERTEGLHIHDGLNPEDDVLATMVRSFEERLYDGKEQEVFNFTLHAVDGLRDAEEQVEMYRLRDTKWGHRDTLELVMDIVGRSEKFQWRPSTGKEVKGLAGHSRGWKLVRMASQEDGLGGKRRIREEGFTSDGREVVAVIAHTFSLRKDFAFTFLGSGRSGALGTAWETTALLSGIWRWWNSINESAD